MITTVTMNAAIDKAYYMEGEIKNGTVMRVASCRNSAGGKGLNVARAAKLCGGDVKATGLVGGFNGKYLEALLDQDGIANEFYHVQGETRSCINILDGQYGSTEYLEPGCEVSLEEVKGFLEKFPSIIKGSSMVTISGSIPKGIPQDIYGRMAAMIKGAGKRVLLDASGEALKQGMKACPTMVKPNQDEIEQLFGVKISGSQDVVAYAEKIYGMGIPFVVVSLGKDGALLACGSGVFQGRPPKVEVANTVGCGDSMVGAFAVALERGDAAEEALRYAVAVATANAMSPDTGNFNPGQCRELAGQVTVERVAR